MQIDICYSALGSLYRLSYARDGAKAIDFLENTSIDLLVTDIQMPTMNGDELIENVILANYEFPIMIISSDEFS